MVNMSHDTKVTDVRLGDASHHLPVYFHFLSKARVIIFLLSVSYWVFIMGAEMGSAEKFLDRKDSLSLQKFVLNLLNIIFYLILSAS